MDTTLNRDFTLVDVNGLPFWQHTLSGRLVPQIAGGDDDPPATADPPAADPPAGDPPASDPPKTYDEAYVRKLRDEAAGNRTKLRELEAKQKLVDDAALTETQRLTKERDEAKTASEKVLSTANVRLIGAEAKIVALTLGIKPERTAAAIKLADLSAITVGEFGEVDDKAIKAALEQVLVEVPELKAAAQGAAATSSTNPARAGSTTAVDPKNLPRLSNFNWKT